MNNKSFTTNRPGSNYK